MKFSEIISAIESEMPIEGIGKVMKWADDTYDNAWTNALDKFHDSLNIGNNSLALKEGEIYKTTVLDLIYKYKVKHDVNDKGSFLGALEENMKV